MIHSKALHWVLRLLAVGAVAAVLASQLHWLDHLELSNHTTLKGRVTRTADGDWRVEPPTGEVVSVAAADVEVRGADTASPVPAVSWGLRSLGERLAGRFPVVFLLLAVLASMLVLTAWRWRMLLKTIDVDLPFPSAVRLTFTGAFFNLAVPGSTGGDVVKAYYAARVTGRGTRSVLSVFVDRAIGLLGLAVLAGIVLLASPPREGYGPARLIVGVVLGGAAVTVAILVNRRLRRLLGLSTLMRRLPFQTLLAEARGALSLYRSHPLALLVALLISLVNHAANAICVWLLAGALGIEGLQLGTALALIPITNLFSAIPLLPGGWGVGELAFAYFLGQVGIPPTEAVSLSVVYRLGMLAVSLPGGALWLTWRGHPTTAELKRSVEAATQGVDALDGTGAPADSGASVGP